VISPWPTNVGLVFALFAAAVGAARPAGAQHALEDEPAPLPAATDVMAELRAALPREPLDIRAELTARDARGAEGAPRLVALELRWGETPPRARYRLLDAFGAPMETLDVTRTTDGETRRAFSVGDPPQAAPPPAPDAAVAGTDFTWGDLALDFLWWTNGVTVGREAKKTRPCVVVELSGPAAEGTTAPRVRLWVDERAHALLQAETLDAEGRTLRRLEVKSLRKIADRWTVEDLDVRTPATGSRTRLRVLQHGAEKPTDETAPPLAPDGESTE